MSAENRQSIPQQESALAEHSAINTGISRKRGRGGVLGTVAGLALGVSLSPVGTANATEQTIPVHVAPGTGVIIESAKGSHLNYNTEGADHNGIVNPSNRDNTVGVLVAEGSVRVNTDGSEDNTPQKVIRVPLVDLREAVTQEIHRINKAGLNADVETTNSDGSAGTEPGQDQIYPPKKGSH